MFSQINKQKKYNSVMWKEFLNENLLRSKFQWSSEEVFNMNMVPCDITLIREKIYICKRIFLV